MRTRGHRDTGTGARPGARTPGQAHGIHASNIADGAVQPLPYAIDPVVPLPGSAFFWRRPAGGVQVEFRRRAGDTDENVLHLSVANALRHASAYFTTSTARIRINVFSQNSRSLTSGAVWITRVSPAGSRPARLRPNPTRLADTITKSRH